MVKTNNVFWPIIILFSVGCSAALVPHTNDPNKKLDQAFWLIQEQERPLPAERLIQEAVKLYENEGNEKGLIKAYWTYGVFFQSEAVSKYESTYLNNGFLDKTATFPNRYTKAIEYFNKAKKIALKLGDYEFLSVIYWNKGTNYEVTGNLIMACKEYEKSLQINRRRYLENNNMKFFIPGSGFLKFSDYEKVIIEYLKSIGCR